MVTLLIIIIYITYVGLGIPDSLLGAAWPSIYTEFNIPVSYSAFVTTLISGGTIISSLLSARIIKRLGTAWTTALSTALTVVALFGFAASKNIFMLCAFAIPLGFGAGSIDTALNNYVALNFKASHVSFLHCAYGVGVSISPYLMSLALKDSTNWEEGYIMMTFIQGGIALLAFLSIPIWKKVSEEKGDPDNERILSIREVIRHSVSKPYYMITVGSCAIESVCLGWGCTFLVDTKGATPEIGAKIITLYFVGMTLGRFLSGFITKILSSMQIVVLGEGITLIAMLIVLFAPNALVAGVGLFAVGLGNGPLFPNLVHLAPGVFGKDVSQSYIGMFMTFSSASILIAPAVFSFIAGQWSTSLFPYFLLFGLVITVVSTVIVKKKIKNIEF